MDFSEYMQDQADRFQRLAIEMHKETDRGCAVLMLCLLEDSAREMLRALIPRPEKGFGRLAPKSGVGALIDTCQVLGLLSDGQARTFRALADVRNRFAHSILEDLSFESPHINALVRKIPAFVPWPIDQALNDSSMRTLYMFHAAMLWLLLAMKKPHVKRLPVAAEIDPSGDVGFGGAALGMPSGPTS